MRFLGLPRFPQGAKALHVLAHLDGSPLGIRHRARAFFLGQTLPLGTRDACGRRFD